MTVYAWASELDSSRLLWTLRSYELGGTSESLLLLPLWCLAWPRCKGLLPHVRLLIRRTELPNNNCARSHHYQRACGHWTKMSRQTRLELSSGGYREHDAGFKNLVSKSLWGFFDSCATGSRGRRLARSLDVIDWWVTYGESNWYQDTRSAYDSSWALWFSNRPDSNFVDSTYLLIAISFTLLPSLERNWCKFLCRSPLPLCVYIFFYIFTMDSLLRNASRFHMPRSLYDSPDIDPSNRDSYGSELGIVQLVLTSAHAFESGMIC